MEEAEPISEEVNVSVEDFTNRLRKIRKKARKKGTLLDFGEAYDATCICYPNFVRPEGFKQKVGSLLANKGIRRQEPFRPLTQAHVEWVANYEKEEKRKSL